MGLRPNLRKLGVVLLACMNAGCQSWVPVRPAELPVELQKARAAGEPDAVRMTSEGRGLVVTNARACQVDTSVVLTVSRGSSPLVQTWIEAGRLKVRETGCECPSPPCTHLDVSDAVVQMRKTDSDRSSGIVVASVFGGLIVVGLLVLLVFAVAHGGSPY